jgi:hypothetical protein
MWGVGEFVNFGRKGQHRKLTVCKGTKLADGKFSVYLIGLRSFS